MPSHGLAARSRSHAGPIGRAQRGEAVGARPGRQVACGSTVKSGLGCRAVVMPTGACDQPGPGRRLVRRGQVAAVRGVRPQSPPAPALRPACRHPRSLCGAARRPPRRPPAEQAATVSRPPQNGDTPTSAEVVESSQAGGPARVPPGHAARRGHRTARLTAVPTELRVVRTGGGLPDDAPVSFAARREVAVKG
jgi:hypothetical protein